MDAQERGAFLTQRLNEYQQLWQKFIEMFNSGVEKEEDEIADEEEMQFRELQADVIRRTQFLEHRMPPGVFDIQEDVYKLFNQSISLRILSSEPSIKLTELRSLWHEVSIALNKMHGQLRTALQEEASPKKKKKRRRY